MKIRNKKGFVKVVTLSLTRGDPFQVTIVGVTCNALITIGAMRNCISETFYNHLMSPWLLKAFCLLVTSAFGNTFCPMGIIQCPFKLGGHCFEFNFIVCRNLTRPIIFGLNFM